MNLEIVLRIIAIVAAIVLVLSNVNLKYLYDFVSNGWKNKTDDFIEIVNLWHILRDKCESQNLKEAVIKLDETFPLLNKEEKNV